MIALVASVVAFQTPALHLVRKGQWLYLVEGRRRLALEGPRIRQARLGKSVIYFEDGGQPEIDAGTGRKKMDLSSKLNEWLKDDELWGGHAAANQMRYMNTGGGGVSAYLTQIASDGGPSGVGVVTLRFNGPSGEPVAGQLLVKVNSAGEVDLVRRLSDTLADMYGRAPERRIYRRGSTRLLLDEGELWKLDLKGNRGKSVAKVAGGNSIGLCDGRYIVLDTPAKGGGDDLDGFDLRTLRSFPIFRDAANAYGKYTYPTWVPEVGTYVLMTKQLDTSGANVQLSVHLPDCRQTKMPAGVNKAWGDYAIAEDIAEVRIYRADSGKLVAKLPMPK